ncbi:MAG: DUF433 domain-containing protein [Anaerolineae bacterium]|nr:DUF433 domain-containing protein [Anaerolineae bacterium]
MAVATIDLTKYIETRLFGDRPHIRGRRIPVATVVYNTHEHQWHVTETAHNFGLSEAEVLSALLYYAENKTLIDAQEATYQADLDVDYEKHNVDD